MKFDLGDGNPSSSKAFLAPDKPQPEGLKKRDLGKEPVNAWGSTNNAGTDPRIDFLTQTYLDSDLSCDEIVESANKRAGYETLLAVTARQTADKKAIIAANATAIAKGALEMVASITEEADSKTKKHVAANMVNKKCGNAENSKVDEELARNLHVSMNMSSQFVKKSANSDVEAYTDKRGKRPTVNSKGLGEREAEDLSRDGGVAVVNGIISKQIINKSLKIGRGVAEPSHLKGKVLEASDDLVGVGKKRKRTKEKKLPLNVCSSKDLSTANDEVNAGKSGTGLNCLGIRIDNMVPMDPSLMLICREFRPPRRFLRENYDVNQ